MNVKARIVKLENLVADMDRRAGQLERGFKGPLIVPPGVISDPDALAVSIEQYSELFYGTVIVLPAVEWNDKLQMGGMS